MAARSFHGSLSTFDATQEDWVEYAERLEHYFVANSIDNGDVQRAILLTNVGPATYRLAKTLSLPKKPTDYTFAQLVKMVTAHFHPKPSPILKRFEFNTRSQEEGESVAVFVAALRSIAEYCEYKDDILPDMLRDRIVCGIRDKAVQRSLLKESKLTYESALDTALAAEAAAHDCKQLQERQKPQLPVNRMNHKQGTGSKKTTTGGSNGGSTGSSYSDCYRCGGKHSAAQC
uniref:Retrotransposon gag domain-containing protein n=1 Tax=Amphimedon queenslandica TaxID=400682 RepID=A0A1X7T248_AMPQE